MSAIQFSQIHPRAFAHPLDRKATAAFENIPLFPELMKKISKFGFEERLRAHHMCNSVQVGSRQLPTLYRMVDEISKRLCILPPKTYVTRHGGINAFAFGRNTHTLVLTTDLVDLMSDEELRGVIAHEMGHILCQHMLYMAVGLALTSGALSTFGRALPGVEEAVNSLFFTWFRAAEYSADRAAMLILDDPEPLAQCLSRLAGVPRRFETEFDRGQFAKQVTDYEEEATLWSKIVTLGMDAFLKHPEPAKRVGAILAWAESEEYKAIRSGHYLTRFEAEALDRIQIEGVRSCPLCRSPVGQAEVCPQCELPQDPAKQQSCLTGHLAGIDWKFCKVCGQPLKARA